MRGFLNFKSFLFPGLIFSLVLCFLFFVAPSAHADTQNYKTAYNVTYTSEEDGTTHAVMKIGLTNLTSKYYASSYKLQIGFPDITNIKASDKKGAITPVLKKMEEGYIVELTFNDKVVGIGNTVNFTISFDVSSIARKHGDVWEIAIPATAKQETFSDFTITVKPHSTFGSPTVIRPKAKDKSLTFTKEQLGKSGVLILFGDKQQYSYSLTYHLKNNNVFPIQTEIALPPSTNYQDSIIESLDPKPKNVLMDIDGNWLAQYDLRPSERKDIFVKGKAIVYLYPRESVLTDEQRNLYTQEKPYWQATPEIKKIAQGLKSPKAIYDYTVKKLSYDYARRTSTTKTRTGAKDILSKPDNAVCLEFTDLFIALSRAAGIPAREVDGFAYTDNKLERPLSLITDVLHAWPEYYDSKQKMWIMVDPTWGDTTGGMDYFTTLDLDHLAFVIKGKESNYPVPAGGYKLSENDLQRDIDVSFTKDVGLPKQTLSILPLIDKAALSGFPIKVVLSVTNTGSGLSSEQEILITSDTLTPKVQSIKLVPIPPGGTRHLDVEFQKTPFLTKGTHTFTMSVSATTLTHTLFVTPFYVTKWHVAGGILFAVLTISLLILARQTGRLPFFKR